jgi:ribosomal protein S18 acetylase RimI-like enzyme
MALDSSDQQNTMDDEPQVRIRRLNKRDLNRTWEFVKEVFREVNRATVEYQRPRSKKRFLEVYDEKGIEQLLFVVKVEGKEHIVGYAECALTIVGTDNWMNERYFRMRDMRPLFVEELAVHPDYQGRGLGTFVLEQLEHLARLRGCTHLVLEVAENNENALKFYRTRSFAKLDAAVFLAKKVVSDPDLLPPRRLKQRTSSKRMPAVDLAAAPTAPTEPKDKPPED